MMNPLLTVLTMTHLENITMNTDAIMNSSMLNKWIIRYYFIIFEDVVYNWPYLYYEGGKQKIINSVCSRIVDYSEVGDPFKGSNCLEYNTELLRQKLNSSSYN